MPPKIKTMTVSLDVRRGGQMRRLAKLRSQGWQIVSSAKRSALAWCPNKTDFVLEKEG